MKSRSQRLFQLTNSHLSWLIGFVAVQSFGCAFAHVNRPPIDKHSNEFEGTRVVSLLPEEAINVASESVEAIGYEVQVKNPKLGLVRTRPRGIMCEGICDCGTWNGRAVSGEATSILVLTIRAETQNTSVIVIEHQCMVSFAGQNLKGATTRRETYQCASTGKVENQFWSTLNQVMQRR